jgi:hypothetical protein
MLSRQDFGGGGGISSVPWWLGALCHASRVPKLLRDPEFQVGDGHGLRISRFLGGPSGPSVGFLVPRGAFVPFDLDQVHELALASQRTHHILDASR